MNKPFFLRRNKYRNGLLQGPQGLINIVITAIVVLAIVLRLVAPGILSSLTSPLWGAGTVLTTFVRGKTTTETKESLRESRDRLAGENAVLSAQNAALASQVADLKALLGSRVEPEKAIVASVLARPPVAPYDVLIVDQGTASGVAVGALAMGPGGTPIGLVGESDTHQSRVALFSTSGLKNDGWAGASRIPVTLVGRGAGAFAASVPKQAGIVVGDAIYLAGHGAIPIGTVISIESNPSSPSVDLNVRPYANPFALTWITIDR